MKRILVLVASIFCVNVASICAAHAGVNADVLENQIDKLNEWLTVRLEVLACMEETTDISEAMTKLEAVYQASSSVLSISQDLLTTEVPRYKKIKESLWRRHAENLLFDSIFSGGKSSQREFIEDWNDSVDDIGLDPDTVAYEGKKGKVVMIDPNYEYKDKKIIGYKNEYIDGEPLAEPLFRLRKAVSEQRPRDEWRRVSSLHKDAYVFCKKQLNEGKKLTKFPKLKGLFTQIDFD